LPLGLLIYLLKKRITHLALIVSQSATVIAADRPWWEADVAAEMVRIEAQNEAIRQAIDAELRYHNAAVFTDLEKVSAFYLQQTEARWTENDEAVIREEIRRLNDSMRPYFDVNRGLFDVDGYMTDRSKR
jgi:CRISPR/Cas system CMR-associated protein Cmr1 (group 7 of RAMP superfamily)